MKQPNYPSLYQINTRVWLTELSRLLGRPATLDDIPDQELDRLKEMGFDWLWFLSVWSTGELGRKVSRENKDWRRDFEETLPDLREEDIAGSGFAITSYKVHPNLGGDAALKRLRARLQKRGLKLMLDFVPNHTAMDHPWVEEHPEFYVTGTELDILRKPQNYTWIRRKRGDLLLACGRDPYFPGWPDVLQLNYGNPATQEAMIGELQKIAGQCDGVRCDMAMLVLPDVFERTWGIRAGPFWPKATQRVREKHPNFQFMAEVYWDMEWTMQQQGFDYTYDKRLYDRLREQHAKPVVYSEETSHDNPNGNWRAGAGDVLFQGVLIRKIDKNNAFGFGSQLIVPTATEDQMGKGKVQSVPTIAWRTAMNSVCNGSFFAPMVRYGFDIGGSDSRSHISELQVNPILHFPLPDAWSVRLWSSPDFKYDFMQNKWFIPADIVASRKLTKRFGIAFQLAAPIYHSEDFKSYDWKVETRLGFYY